MEVTIVSESPNSMELKVTKEQHTVCNLLRDKLLSNGADMAGYKEDHPAYDYGKLFISSKKPKDTLKKAADEAIKDLKDLSAAFQKAVKE